MLLQNSLFDTKQNPLKIESSASKSVFVCQIWLFCSKTAL
jgi:hypothetical protein